MRELNPFALKTPCFVFNEEELTENLRGFGEALNAAWPQNAVVAYSVKTNPFPWILACARNVGCYAEVVSDEEYDLALAVGFEPRHIVFNGPIKGKERFFYALENRSIVNLDAMRELDWLEEYAAQQASGALEALEASGDPEALPESSYCVGIRVNFDLEAECKGQTLTGETGGRFGFCLENGELAKAIARLEQLSPWVRINGLHMHVTTSSRSQEVYQALARKAAYVIKEFSLSVDFVDVGGGFYGGGKGNVGAYDAYAKTISCELETSCSPAQTMLIVEPGGAVVCTPGSYFGRVLDAKETTYGRFVTCDLSRLNIDHEMKKTSYAYRVHTDADVVDANPGSRSRLPNQVLCGFTCMESDRLCILNDEIELKEGDIIEIKNAGAYSMSFTPGFFIRYAPAVYAFNGSGTCVLLRGLQGTSDLNSITSTWGVK